MSNFDKPQEKSYRPAYCAIAQTVYRLGGAKEDLAAALDTTISVLGYWESRHPEFRKASRAGQAAADDRVEAAVLALCRGYEFKAEKIWAYRGRVYRQEYTKRSLPDPAACQFVLTSLSRKYWKLPREIPPHQAPDEVSAWLNTFETVCPREYPSSDSDRLSDKD